MQHSAFGRIGFVEHTDDGVQFARQSGIDSGIRIQTRFVLRLKNIGDPILESRFGGLVLWFRLLQLASRTVWKQPP